MIANIPVIDTHLHLWDPGALSYPWLATVPSLNKQFLPGDYQAATEALPIEKLIFVQCEAALAQYRDEVNWVTAQARVDSRIKGIVAWAPLEKGEAACAELAALAQNPFLRGIRRIIQFEDDVAFCLRPDFVRGVRLLADFGLSFDICIKGDAQFRNTLELVRQCPRVNFILDHIGKPFIKEKLIEPWGTYLKALAQMPNTWCKMSGLVNEADKAAWTPDDLRPYIEHVLECFGFDRVAFGGDWPVCTLASSYKRWFDVLHAAVSGCAQENLKKLFHDNAAEFYRV